jgi:hypothetical protein
MFNSVWFGLHLCWPARTDRLAATTAPTVVQQYLELLDTLYHAGATEQDVDALMAMVADEGRYTHKGYGADFSKPTWRAAFLRNQKLGRFNKSAHVCKELTQAILG